MKVVTTYETGQHHGYSIKYSPFRRGILACAACENYGITGRGFLYLINLQDVPHPSCLLICQWTGGLFDVAWSEVNENLLVTGCADGSVLLWDSLKPDTPVAFYKIHEKEVSSVQWNPKNVYSYILSSSWDSSVRLWDPFLCKEICKYVSHADQVYEASWSPHLPEIFASVSADMSLKVWDIRCSSQAVSSYSYTSEILCLDWSKSDRDIIAVGTTDGKIIGWDLKKMSQPVFVLVGHQYAVRRVKFSPYERGSLATVSYDFSTRFWSWFTPNAKEILEKHTEFVYGLDFNPVNPSEVADCAWDSLINVYNGKISS